MNGSALKDSRGVKMSKYVIQDKKTQGFYIKTDKDGATWWAVSEAHARKFDKCLDAMDVAGSLDNDVIIVKLREGVLK